jgi:hypothetical protein
MWLLIVIMGNAPSITLGAPEFHYELECERAAKWIMKTDPRAHAECFVANSTLEDVRAEGQRAVNEMRALYPTQPKAKAVLPK